VKTRGFASILLFSLFYTTLLSTMVVIPLLLASRYDAGMATVDRDTQVWERSLDVPANVKPHGELRLPQSDVSVSGPAVRHAPIDKSGPDAAMIKPGKARAEEIRAALRG
jgi:hypothetical protein